MTLFFDKKSAPDRKYFFVSNTHAKFFLVCLFSLSIFVIALGAYTRLVHAGLGCPDWPGCYGHLTWPSTTQDIQKANQAFPEIPVDQEKTWPEMVHRYIAGLLGIGIFIFTLFCYRNHHLHHLKMVSTVLSVLVIFQALLGMWTVTLKLWPQVVTLHLLGGFSTASLLLVCLSRIRLTFIKEKQTNNQTATYARTIPYHQTAPYHQTVPYYQTITYPQTTLYHPILVRLLWIFFSLVVVQITLGGWTSANYAAMACPDFPTCQAQWLPAMDWNTAFTFWQSQGPNYLGGQLDGDARVAIHWLHRLGALILWVVACSISALFLQKKFFLQASLLFLAVNLQIIIGILNVFFSWPLFLALAHNIGALLLLLSVIICLERHYCLFFNINTPNPVNFKVA